MSKTSTYQLRVQLTIDHVTLSIFEGEQQLDKIDISYHRDLDDQFIVSLDKILKSNSISIEALTSHVLESDLPEHSTSLKITQALMRGLGFRHV